MGGRNFCFVIDTDEDFIHTTVQREVQQKVKFVRLIQAKQVVSIFLRTLAHTLGHIAEHKFATVLGQIQIEGAFVDGSQVGSGDGVGKIVGLGHQLYLNG